MTKRETIYSVVIHAVAGVRMEDMRSSLAEIGYPMRVVRQGNRDLWVVGCTNGVRSASKLLTDIRLHGFACSILIY